MINTLLTAGVVCIIAAIVGGGLKAFGIEIPIVASQKRQLILGIIGVLLLGSALITVQPIHEGTKSEGREEPTLQERPQTPTPPPSPLDVKTEPLSAVWKKNYELVTGPLGRYEISPIGVRVINGNRISDMLKQLDLTGESALESDKNNVIEAMQGAGGIGDLEDGALQETENLHDSLEKLKTDIRRIAAAAGVDVEKIDKAALQRQKRR